MKVVSVVGARPQFVKLAPIDDVFRGSVEHLIVHTGQHYDDAMSDGLFRDLGISPPTVNLETGSGSHGQQTAKMMPGLEDFIQLHEPDWVLLYGDTNSTLAGAVVASKMGIPIAHLEAGLRSFNRGMPEEINRVVTDHVSDLCLAPTALAMDNLKREGLASRSVYVGDVMVDALRRMVRLVQESPPRLDWLAGNDKYFIATLHRQELTDDKGRLSDVLDSLSRMQYPVFLAVHPRLRKRFSEMDFRPGPESSLKLIDPLSYPELVYAVANSSGVVTDSGGLQKETYLLRKPCVTVRPETEWQETVDAGWNTLVWDDLSFLDGFPDRVTPAPHDPDIYGPGDAAQKVFEALKAR